LERPKRKHHYLNKHVGKRFDRRYTGLPGRHRNSRAPSKKMPKPQKASKEQKASKKQEASKPQSIGAMENNIDSSSQEEAFQARPSMNFPVSDHIKALLVDDWENITKNNQLVPLPHPHPVDKVLNDYLAFEHPNREEGSASRDILDETIAGFREYFDKALSRILLYR
jgi:mortality factor 4-like protein 1